MSGDGRHPGLLARRALAIMLAAGCAVAVAEQPAEAPGPAPLDPRDVNLGFAPVPGGTIAPLIERLGSWKFAERQQAAKDLADLGPGAFYELSRIYRTRDDFEVRLQIEDVVREQFLWHSLLKHKGFLGVSYAPTQILRDGRPQWVIVVNFVRPDTAAADAGILETDLVVGVDGRQLDEEPGQESFRELIGAKGAGAKILLDIQRDDQRLQVEVVLRARPMAEYNTPALAEELASHLQSFSAWWGRHFSLPAHRAERSPSSSVLELPE